ncbi:MAG: Gfo/Idh/MocA family oxidoreductase [Candidatus Hydrogenedentes bacterium]|nr:Gfo/Idh/MocA family oxidoreductase [Candidatus Hydrogenedentota bacterium]
MKLTRRAFIGGAATAALIAGTRATGTVFGANERVRVACVGLNGRGGSHIDAFSSSGNSEVVALCDVDSKVLQECASALETKTGKKPVLAADVRELLARDDVDAISIATPNHLHTIISIWACQAGKDVYVEKPLSHDFWEGKQLVAAAKKFNRVVQHGTQSRSSATWQKAINLIQNGAIGEVHTARGCVYKNGNRGSIGIKDNCDPPEWLNWNLWQGPAQEQPFNPNYHPYNWHWFWRYGNGEIGNQGVHQMDIAVWGLNKGLPVKVYTGGGRYTYKDQAETPNTSATVFTYADGTMMTFEVRNRFTNDESGVRVGNIFYGSEGYYVQNKGFFDKDDKPVTPEEETPKGPSAFENFINAVKSRKPEDIHGNAEQGHLSAAHCHLANISYRLGRSLVFDPATEKFVNDDEANSMLRAVNRPGFEVPEIA